MGPSAGLDFAENRIIFRPYRDLNPEFPASDLFFISTLYSLYTRAAHYPAIWNIKESQFMIASHLTFKT